MNCILKKIPLLRYLKEPVGSISVLYKRYPRGGQTGWFAFVNNVKAFAFWDADAEEWKLLAGSGGSVDLSGIESDIDALQAAAEQLRYGAVHMVNHARGCVDIDTSVRKLEITDDVYVYAGTERVFCISPASVPWIVGDYPDNDTYFVVLDGSTQISGMDRDLYVIGGNADTEDWPELANPVFVGMFHVLDGEVQGLSFCSDDVKVDGVYIYDNPPAINIVGDATFLGDARGDMNIDTVNKRITIAHDAVVIANNKRYTVPAGNYAWNKGNAVDYSESIYTVYAVILNGSPATVSLAVMSSSALFVPPAAGTGVAFRIGAFYWTGSAVGGINFGNDVFVDGAYIYGAGGSSGGDAWTMELIAASKDWTVPTGCDRIDAFIVGGGGAGAGGGSSSLPGGGGGGGYTVAALGLSVNSGEVLSFEIGAGGLAQASGADGGSGGASRIKRSSVTIAEALGGSGGRSSDSGGGNGGSGGGAGRGDTATTGGNGGSNGSDGSDTADANGGTGQHTSTLCPLNGLLYAGGGGGARYSAVGGFGGAGGGGNAGHSSSNGGSGSPNTGGGGGGAWTSSSLIAGNGGSGVIILRYRS